MPRRRHTDSASGDCRDRDSWSPRVCFYGDVSTVPDGVLLPARYHSTAHQGTARNPATSPTCSHMRRGAGELPRKRRIILGRGVFVRLTVEWPPHRNVPDDRLAPRTIARTVPDRAVLANVPIGGAIQVDGCRRAGAAASALDLPLAEPAGTPSASANRNVLP